MDVRNNLIYVFAVITSCVFESAELPCLTHAGLPPDHKEVQLKDLAKWVIPRVAPKWDEVGLQLGIQQYVLRSVEADGSDVVTRCRNMFDKWLDGQKGAGRQQRTWESVLEAVREAVGSEVCKAIEQSICNEGELMLRTSL